MFCIVRICFLVIVILVIIKKKVNFVNFAEETFADLGIKHNNRKTFFP